MRILASIRSTLNLIPIEGADFIELAQIDGWQCVVKKGEFAIGDLGVYFEIDSFLPAEDSRYEFLSKNFIHWEGNYGARIRSQKLRGAISQGLFIPVSLFPEIVNPSVGLDVTDILGIKKWEPMIPANLAGEVEGLFPNYISKTDQERIQNLVEIIPIKIAGHTFEETVKLDGSSMTVFLKDGLFGVCGRNWWLKPSENNNENNSLWKVTIRNNFENALRIYHSVYGRNIALQGEIIGEGIQGNHESLKGQDFYLYDIFDIDNQRYFSPKEREEAFNFLKDHSDIKHVPVIDYVTFENNVTVADILAMADGTSLNNAKREGVVFKSMDGKFSFKAISNWYLLKYGDR